MNQQDLQQGVHLTFYCHQRSKHGGMLLTEWLLEQAKRHRFGGGTVFRAIAGFGRHGVLHEEQFFELTDDLPVKVEFLLRTAEADQLIELARAAGVDAVYAQTSATFAVLGKR
jgi:PII-like signaling protein